MPQQLIKGGTIVTVDTTVGTLDRGDLLIEDDKIVEVHPRIDAPQATILDAQDMIVFPGLINAHLHTWETVLRGVGADWTGHQYFDVLLGRLARHFTPDDMYVSTLLGALNQIDAGCTTLFDWCHNTKTYDHTDMAIKGLEDAGIRAVFGHGTPKPNPNPGEPHFSTLPFPRDAITRLRRGRFADNGHGLVSLAMCILGPDYAAIDVNRHDFALAKELDLMTSSHVWGGNRRLTPGGYQTIVDAGLMDAKHNAVHANFFEDDEVKLLVDHGASITATPVIEVGVPKPPLISAVLRAGGQPSIAVDTEVEVCGSMFDSMRGALQLQRTFDAIGAFDPTRITEDTGRPDANSAQSAHETVCTSADALQWATLNNAKALCLDAKTGSLTAGKQADLVMIRKNDLNLIPAREPVQTIVIHANQANVDTVMIAGRVVKSGGRLHLQGLDIGNLRQRLQQACDRLLAKSHDLGHPLL